MKVSDIQLRMVTGTLDRIGSKQQLEQGTAMNHKLDKQFESDIFSNTTLKGKLGVNALVSQKSLYDLVVVDTAGIEMNFAKDLEERNEVAVYTE